MQAPPVIPRPRPRLGWWLGCALLLSLAGGVVLFRFNPSQYGFYPRCALYSATGIYCPGCGSQRALYHLLHGRLAMALHCNALLILSLPFLATALARYLLLWAANKPMPPFFVQSWWIKWLIGVIIVFTILRNIPCAPFSLLAPL